MDDAITIINKALNYVINQETINDSYKKLCIKSEKEKKLPLERIDLPVLPNPLTDYYNDMHQHFHKSPDFKLENVEWIDNRINELKQLRKNKKIEYVDYCKQVKKLTHMKNRQIKRQQNFYNNYTLKYDYYNPLVDAQLYSDTYDKCRTGVAWKRPYQSFNLHRIENIGYIIDSMKRLDINTRPHKHFKVNERGKIRDISAPDINERLIQSILSTHILHPLTDNTVIYDNYACQKGKGIDLAIRRYKKFLSDAYKKYGSSENIYVLKLDIRHFFESISHEKAIEIWSRYVKTPETLEIMRQLFSKYITKTGEYTNTGLCLGSELSQLTATIFLSKLDHIIKEKYKVEYGRYNDDIFIIHNSDEYLKKILFFINNELHKLGLTLNENKSELIRMSNRNGVKMLKIKFIYDRYKKTGEIVLISGRESAVRERRKLRKMLKKLKNGEITFDYIYNVYKGWRKHILKTFNAYNLICFNDEYFKKLYNIKYINFKHNQVEFRDIRSNYLYVLKSETLDFKNESTKIKSSKYKLYVTYNDYMHGMKKIPYEADANPEIEKQNKAIVKKYADYLEQESLKMFNYQINQNENTILMINNS